MNISDLIRRLENIVRKGVICEVDYNLQRCRVQTGDIKTTFLPWMTPRAGEDKTWDAPSIGEQCVIFSESGELTQGIVFFGAYSDAHPCPEVNPNIKSRHFSDGAVIRYDVENHVLQAILPADGTAILTAMGGITLNGNTTINGDLQTNGHTTMTGNNNVGGSQSVDGTSHAKGSLTCEGDVTASGISLTTHKHGNVQSGSSDTGGPKA